MIILGWNGLFLVAHVGLDRSIAESHGKADGQVGTKSIA
jgi:hypothetical protein